MLNEFTQRRMNKIIKEGGGIYRGEAHTICDGHIVDKYGRRLETVKEATIRLEKRDEVFLSIYGKPLAKPLEYFYDSEDGKHLNFSEFPAGKIIDEEVINSIIFSGFDAEAIKRNYTI